MTEETTQITGAESAEVAANRQLIKSARDKGPLAVLGAFCRLSGPGWLQSAITLGGGSLSSSLYLGFLAGTALLWLQPVAMIIGVIMLSAISYVVLSTGERPFRAINRHVSPVLGWGWLIATMMANIVWSLPQFSLATAALKQNLFTGSLGKMPETAGNITCVVVCAIVATIVVILYDKGQRGAKICDAILKTMVAIIVLSFFGVVIKLSAGGGLDWGKIFAGFVPNLKMLGSPSKDIMAEIAMVATAGQDYWKNMVVSQQRGVMVAAAATAVGINMTFLLPYSMLRRGWDRDFRGMAVFDLATGLFIPFILVVSCVVMVAGSQFHTKPVAGFLGEVDEAGVVIEPSAGHLKAFNSNLVGRARAGLMGDERLRVAQLEQVARGKDGVAAKLASAEISKVLAPHVENLPEVDRRLAAMLIKRDAFGLAKSLEPLTGKVFSHYIFGVGVVGMAVSSIIILMLINGFVICEILDKPAAGKTYLWGCMLPLLGVLGPFIWTGKAKFWLAVPTSNIAFVFLPFAYLAFACLLNSEKLLGDAMPRGKNRVIWNLLVWPSAILATLGAIWKLWSGLGVLGIQLLGAALILTLAVHTKRGNGAEEEAAA